MFDPKKEERKASAMDELEEELKRYQAEHFDHETLSLRADVLKVFWKPNKHKYPLLVRFVREYLCVPATSAPAERLFSIAGEIVSKKRACLASDTIEALTYLHFNWRYVYRASSPIAIGKPSDKTSSVVKTEPVSAK